MDNTLTQILGSLYTANSQLAQANALQTELSDLLRQRDEQIKDLRSRLAECLNKEAAQETERLARLAARRERRNKKS